MSGLPDSILSRQRIISTPIEYRQEVLNMTFPSSVRLSKFLSLVLRHKPETINLHLDAQGWADAAELLTQS